MKGNAGKISVWRTPVLAVLSLQSLGNPFFICITSGWWVLAAVALPVQADIQENLELASLQILVLVKGMIALDSRNPSCA